MMIYSPILFQIVFLVPKLAFSDINIAIQGFGGYFHGISFSIFLFLTYLYQYILTAFLIDTVELDLAV